jgi:hypothetical protein
VSPFPTSGARDTKSILWALVSPFLLHFKTKIITTRWRTGQLTGSLALKALFSTAHRANYIRRKTRLGLAPDLLNLQEKYRPFLAFWISEKYRSYT